MLKQPNVINEASFHDVTITTTPKSLINLCLKYNIKFYMANDGEDKTNFDFEFETHDGCKFLVYDWKEYRSIDLDEEIEFHIGAKDRSDSNYAFNILQDELTLLNQ